MSERHKRICRFMTVIFIVLMSLSTMHAQPKSLGAVFAFTGVSVSYEHDLDRYDSFFEVSLKSEMSEYFRIKEKNPGISASASWNFLLKNWTSAEGNTVSLFAGPGVLAGYGPDFKQSDGFFFGLKGRIGFECSYARNVIISAFVSPTWGSHIAFDKDYHKMRSYMNGFIYSIVPEIGIKYRF